MKYRKLRIAWSVVWLAFAVLASMGMQIQLLGYRFVQDTPLAVMFAVIAFLPLLPWWSNRFSLRTLLIATTLIAIVLGLIVAVA